MNKNARAVYLVAAAAASAAWRRRALTNGAKIGIVRGFPYSCEFRSSSLANTAQAKKRARQAEKRCLCFFGLCSLVCCVFLLVVLCFFCFFLVVSLVLFF